MAFNKPAPAITPAKPASAPAANLPPAKPKAPAVAPAAAAPGVPPVLPFVPPAKPKVSALLTDAQPASHFALHDPPQATTGVRQDPPANEQQSVPDDPSMPMGLNQPLGWDPFANVPQ